MALKISVLLFTLVIFITFTSAANILAILPTPSYSHQIAYSHIWKELSLRGHKVTSITTDPLNDPTLTNLTEIDVKWSYSFATNVSHFSQIELSMWDIHEVTHRHFLKLAETQLSHKDIQNLIHSKNHFDVVLVEVLFPEFLGFAELYNCPKILFSALTGHSFMYYYMGDTIHPAMYPEFGTAFYMPLTFKERVISAVYTVYYMCFYSYSAFVDKTMLMQKYFNISRSLHDLLSDLDMVFVNVNPILQYVRPLGPLTVTISHKREIMLNTPLPKELSKYLDDAVDGFIYFSLGSNIQSKYLNEETIGAITEAFRELPYKVLWKYEGDELPDVSKNVKLIKWAPQQIVLSHPNLRLFVTQGGLLSIEEAFYNGVPMVVIPFFADQHENARMLQSKGVATVVRRMPSVKKLELKNAILEVLNNPKYANNVKKLKQLALDFPMTGLEKAVWWIEYVIRNKGTKHLRNPAADLPFYQYYLIDVISFLIFVLVATCLLLYLVIAKAWKHILLVIFRYTTTNSNKKKMQ